MLLDWMKNNYFFLLPFPETSDKMLVTLLYLFLYLKADLNLLENRRRKFFLDILCASASDPLVFSCFFFFLCDSFLFYWYKSTSQCRDNHSSSLAFEGCACVCYAMMKGHARWIKLCKWSGLEWSCQWPKCVLNRATWLF